MSVANAFKELWPIGTFWLDNITKYETLGADIFEELWLFCDIDDIVTEYETLAADVFEELWLFSDFDLTIWLNTKR